MLRNALRFIPVTVGTNFMKAHFLSIVLLLSNLVFFGQNRAKTRLDFSSITLEKDTSIVLPILYSGGCLCRPSLESIPLLDSLSEIIKQNPNLRFEIENHTDSRGVDSANFLLSKFRASNVVKYLLSVGVSDKQISAVPYGEYQKRIITMVEHSVYDFLPIGSKLTDEFISTLPEEQREICHYLNRRTILKVEKQ